MKTNNTFSVMFYLRMDKTDNKDTAPVFLRITVNGKRTEITASRRFDINRWQNGQPTGNKPDAQELIKYLATLREKVFQIQRDMIDRHELITVENIKKRYHGIDDNSKTLMEAFDYHNMQVKSLIGRDYSIATYNRYETTKRHVLEFLKENYHTNDVFLTQLKFEFITSFEYHLKIKRDCSHNTAVKYVKNFRKIINTALKYDWLSKDPFQKYSAKIKEVDRGYLTVEELTTLEQKQITVPRIELVRDIFVFACYTGLAYAEVEKLTNNHIVKGVDGEQWIHIRRTKTDSKSVIPILPTAQGILEKYKDYLKHKKSDALLPTYSNQKMNAYLKEIADLCGITKDLTFHLARHTFATTVTLTNGVTIESVSAMLGHKDIRTTQIYAKVVEKKVGDEMATLREKLSAQAEKNKIADQ